MSTVYGELTLAPTFVSELTLTGSNGSVVIADDEVDITLLIPVLRGPRGVPGVSAGVELPFSWGDATPTPVVTVPINKRAFGVQLVIDQAFDGVGAQLYVGDAGDPQRLMSAASNIPSEAGNYETNPYHRYTVATPILFTIIPGVGASQGRGLLILTTEQ